MIFLMSSIVALRGMWYTNECERMGVANNSVLRTEDKFRELFEKANMKIRRTEIQKGMPNTIYPVRTFALQPNL